MARFWSVLLVFAVVGFVTVGDLSAKGGKRKSKRAKDGKETQSQFRKLDGDGNGQLTPQEFQGRAKTPAQIRQSEQIFMFCDQNRDGMISRDEFENRPVEARYLAMDRNGDGAVTIDDFQNKNATTQNARKAQERFRKLDKNGDGVVTFNEFKESSGRQGGKKSSGKTARKGKKRTKKKK